MNNSIKISIPTPCHENWGSMTPESRGRFCASCQKTVVDFTKATDREIVNAYNKEANLCGRFRASQLDRDLVIPKEKNSLWAGAAALAVLSLGTTEALAQTTATTEQNEIMGKMRLPDPGKRTITVTILDENQLPLAGVQILMKPYNTINAAVTDMDGNFTFNEVTSDSLLIECIGYKAIEVAITDANTYTIQMEPEELEEVITLGYPGTKSNYVTGGGTIIPADQLSTRRTFFGRIFHSISNIFR